MARKTKRPRPLSIDMSRDPLLGEKIADKHLIALVDGTDDSYASIRDKLGPVWIERIRRNLTRDMCWRSSLEGLDGDGI